MEVEAAEMLSGRTGEPLIWHATCRTDHGIFGGTGATRFAAELDAVSKAAEEDPEAACELKYMLVDKDRQESRKEEENDLGPETPC